MRFRLPWISRQRAKRELAVLENRLSGALKPVELRPTFFDSLREELVSGSRERLLGLPAATAQRVLLVAGALASGVMLVVAGVRTVLSFLGALGLIQLLSRRKDESPPGTARPAA